MLCFDQAGDDLYAIPESDQFQVHLFPRRQWVCMRPRAVVHIDLDQDDYQEIARKLDLWVRIETHRSPTVVEGAPAMLRDTAEASPYSP